MGEIWLKNFGKGSKVFMAYPPTTINEKGTEGMRSKADSALSHTLAKK